jgi:hypothetical protein
MNSQFNTTIVKRNQTKTDKRYVVRVLESQWDARHEQSIRPFFEELRRGRRLYSKGPYKRDRSSTKIESDPLFDYYVFNGTGNLNTLVRQRFTGLGARRKIVYIASHGTIKTINTLTDEDIRRSKLRNAFRDSKINGIIFGSCLFGNKSNAEFFLENRRVQWVAGYDKSVDWLASTISDLLFIRILLDGWFKIGEKRERKIHIPDVQAAAHCLYRTFPIAKELGFNVFYLKKGPGSLPINSLSTYAPKN